jgi:hypothetical protein
MSRQWIVKLHGDGTRSLEHQEITSKHDDLGDNEVFVKGKKIHQV